VKSPKKQKKKKPLNKRQESKVYNKSVINSKSNKSNKIYSQIVGILLISLGLLMFLGFYIDNSIGLFGLFVRKVLLGLFGLPASIVPIAVILIGLLLTFSKNPSQIKTKTKYFIAILILISAIFHTGNYQFSNYQNLNPVDSIVQFYKEGQNYTGGGITGGIISLPLILVFQPLGAVIILACLSIIFLILLFNISFRNINIAKNTKTNVVKDVKTSSIKGQKGEKSGNFFINIEDNNSTKNKKTKLFGNMDKTKSNIKKSGEIIESKQKDGAQSTNINKDVKDKEEITIKQQKQNKYDSYQQSQKESFEFLYKYPPISLLNANIEGGKNSRIHKNTVLECAKKLEETLKSFDVDAKVTNATIGPAVTRYEIQPNTGVKVSRIVNLADDISLNLASPTVRIEAPIPGKAVIGIEVPNKEVSPVFLREVIESREFNQHPSKVAFALGKDISGECVVADIAKMPHLLISGATGSGKSVCIKSLIMSILYKASPDEVKMILIDPKVVELSAFNGIPHLLIPVITEPKKAAAALNWAVQEMVRRYKLFADTGVRDIKGYNDTIIQLEENEYLPSIVIIIDELSDLMMVAPGEVEDAICRLAQMARAAGMYLVVATQRPSVDVITGLIKANIPSRIAFAVSSQVDSRTILDMGGAEKLLGNGDMLFYPVGYQKPVRLQGAYISDKEIEKVVSFIKFERNMEYDDNVIDEINNNMSIKDNKEDDRDELLPQAIDLVVEIGQASVSLLQRKFRVGYARAARMIDQMEARGIIGGFEGSKPRQVLITRQQWLEMKISEEFKRQGT